MKTPELKLIPFGQLKNLNLGDVTSQYLKWFNDEEVSRYLFLTLPTTREAILEWLLECISKTETYYYHILLEENNIGHIGNTYFNKHACENSIVIGEKKHWLKGVGSLALKQLTISAGRKLTPALSMAFIHEDNQPSQNLFHKLGFKPTNHPHYLQENFYQHIKVN